jgi:arylsulfatase A-like enzyme
VLWATRTSAGGRRGSRRRPRALACLALALAACGGAPPPSILLVTLDTLRRDHVGAYGDARGLTPHLDALAAEGLVYQAAYTAMPTTAPAHVSLFTGLWPSQHGVRRNGEPLAPAFAPREAAERLRRSGYATAAIVTTRLLSADLTGLRGFEVYDAPHSALRSGGDAVRSALAWLDVERRRPVFLWVHLYDAHAPYGSADEKRRSFPVDPGSYGFVDRDRYAAEGAVREMEARYARGVRAADAALGALVAGVRERLARPPLVIAVADHGELLAEHLGDRGYAFDHGEFLDAECVEIPLVLAGPGVRPGRSRGAVSIRDLYATLLAAGGVAPAPEAGLRDLRRPDDARRLVEIERRELARTSGAVRAQAAGAADGAHLVVVGEDGETSSGGGAPEDLVDAARETLGRIPRRERAPQLDAAAQRALRELGYAE